MRLFFAITFPDRIKTALADISQRLQAQLPSGHWTRRENYHLTLVFLGEMTPTQASAAKTVARHTAKMAFLLFMAFPPCCVSG
jgi:2'-5' RNA ligase